MPREIYSITPISEVTPTQINRLIVELNSVFSNLSEQLANLEGRDGRTSKIYGDIDLQGKHIKNVARSASKMDVPNVEELIEKALYEVNGRHVASVPIQADAGIVTPRAESDGQAVPLAQLLSEVNIAIGSLVTGPASATDNGAARFDGTTGKLLQDSLFIIDDDGDIEVISPWIVTQVSERFRLTGGILSFGTTVTTGASAGDILMNNARFLRFIRANLTNLGARMGMTASNIMEFQSGAIVVLADTATVVLTGEGGMVFVTNSSGESALFVASAAGTPIEVADPSGTYSVTQGTATSSNVYRTAGNLTLENNTGGSKSYSIFVFQGG